MEPHGRLTLYRAMVLIRTFEEGLLREHSIGKKPRFDLSEGPVPGRLHLAAGQEPAAVGVCAALEEGDAVTATHRAHHFAIAHGVRLRVLAAEIFGRTEGLARGRGGHQHLVDPARNFRSSGSAGEGLPAAVGHALAFRRQGGGRVAVAVIGDGAANRGVFHESLNLASVWSLPVIFVVENNDWAFSAPYISSTSVPAHVERALAYDIPGELVDDNSVEAVEAVTRSAVERARSGEGPSLVEVRTLRLWGHAQGDDQAYRFDLDSVPGRDPIPAYEARLRAEGLVDDDVVRLVRKQAREKVADAIAFARRGGEPSPETALDYVFV
ncbi:pyruvate dehydrogenase (acetyl-transferring) E1 component subunit alpha [Prauserella marina]|uniref:Pyruvate dehydrogenase E1 component alpha subunit n=1 Tax=Prauserella marina TaxID=530584 RepID=A0A222VTW2_9PSEU|nr:thiamine pyrophosphate-dependent dehydrogenase E1 component subunit alpha [Prauserella marina]ASR37359.1 pyruvate dehydrogenase (acetyl-transferring) E1 component subunit alpha [Prauserella marina]PWV74776.1 pyruvate dehydrogenase E1 component alpha subunit [Prauserella marina]SDD40988.1 pyruvate dehydrogenase E1 component alpha subunit [Prauserella marina]